MRGPVLISVIYLSVSCCTSVCMSAVRLCVCLPLDRALQARIERGRVQQCKHRRFAGKAGHWRAGVAGLYRIRQQRAVYW